MWHIMRESGCAYRLLLGKLEGKGSIGRPRHRWEDNITMNLKEMGEGHGLEWSGSE
jgi:hypothetical protein